jgi:hypothetical protein
MLSIERAKELINDPRLSDKEIEEIRNQMYMLSELIFEQWMAERNKAKENQKMTDSEGPRKENKE